MKQLTGFLLTILMILSLPAAGQTDCTFEHFSVNDGLSQHTVSAIFQDSRDIVWFGTFNGLNSFDGYRFRHYRPVSSRNPEVTSSRIDLIEEDLFGKLWVLTHDGKPFRLERGTGRFIALPDSVLREGVRVKSIVTSPSGNIWMPTQEGIIQVVPAAEDNNTTAIFYDSSNSVLPSDKVLTVLPDVRGLDLIITSRGISVCGGAGEIIQSGADINKLRTCVPFGSGLICGTSEGRVIVLDHTLAILHTEKVASRAILNLYDAGDGRVLMLTSADGFILYDVASGQRHSYSAATNRSIPRGAMLTAVIDSHGEAWITTEESGILQFTIATGEVTMHRPEVDKAGVYADTDWGFVIEDANGFLWVYPKGGGFSYYDREERKLRYFYNHPDDPASRFSNVLLQAFSDRQGNLWMSTFSRGIEKISFRDSKLESIVPNSESSAVAVNEVRAVMRQPDGMAWLATRDGSLYKGPGFDNLHKAGWNGRTGTIPYFDAFVYCITEDSRGNIWLGTRNKGVFVLTPQGESGGQPQYRVENLTSNDANPYSISSNSVYTIYEDTEGTMWFGTWEGGINYLEDFNGQKRFIHSGNYLRDYPRDRYRRVRHITGDNNGNLLIATTEGLIIWPLQGGGEGHSHPRFLNHIPGKNNSLAANDVHRILVTGGTIWLATFGGGLNKVTTTADGYTVEYLNTETGFPADIILTLEQDAAGALWMSSENYIIKYDPQTGASEVNAPTLSATQLPIFSEGASLRDIDGSMIFGHGHGAYRIATSQEGGNVFTPSLHLSRLLLFNNEVSPDDPGSPLERHIDETEKITLNHSQRVFGVEFAALDYRNSSQIDYAYMLEGFDRDWNMVGNQRLATYTNLPYGRYTFHVRSTNADKVWTENTRSVEFTIRPPFWLTGWAYFLYALAIAGAILIVNKIIFSFYKLRNEVEVEKKMTDMKLRFFTDISHEIRTPLTLISSPVEHLLQTGQIPDAARKTLSTVKLNTDRLLRLVNQLLDFRKIQNNRMKLYIEPIELGIFAGQVCETFVREAEERDIKFSFHDFTDNKKVWLDKDKAEKILYNILSNAFKFTPTGHGVSCVVSDNIGSLDVVVEDEGEGIPADKLSLIFERYESTDSKQSSGLYVGNSHDPDDGSTANPGEGVTGDSTPLAGKPIQSRKPTAVSSQKGTGIGLTLVRELVDLHRGSITVESEPGRGTKVTVCFPKNADELKALPYCFLAGNAVTGIISHEVVPNYSGKDSERDPEVTGAQNGDSSTDGNQETSINPARKTILFIEDNNDVRDFLREVAEEQYSVLEAADGEAGTTLARSLQPDIIVTDLMMEGMDGFEVVRTLREEIDTSHIPIIILTARTELDDRLLALELGADDFITKPFSAAYLMARVGNLLERRQKLHGQFAKSVSKTASKSSISIKKAVSPSDARFMEKLLAYMEANIENPDLRIEDFLGLLCVSRSLLFKKLKSLTGFSPVEFIREFRIQRATELILKGELSVKEVTYKVGMNDSRYFARCFKQKHGMTPSEYKALHTGDKEAE